MAKRVFQGVVLFFAIYAFVFVPLGKRTGLEHVRAIAGTTAAKQAGTELKGGVERLVQRLRDQAQQSTDSSDHQSLPIDRKQAKSTQPQRIAPTRLTARDRLAPPDISDPSQLEVPSLDELDGALPRASGPAAQSR
jgi:hypothetical protein